MAKPDLAEITTRDMATRRLGLLNQRGHDTLDDRHDLLIYCQELEVENAKLRAVLQEVYNEIPSCRCNDGFTGRGLVDPACTRHYDFGDDLLTKITVALKGERNG